MDLTLRERADARIERFGTIWIDYGPQQAANARIRAYMRRTSGIRGISIDGRRLSQETQAGKSALAWRLKQELAAERAAAGLPENPHQVVIVTIEKFQTLKSFYIQILGLLGDDFAHVGADERTRPAELKAAMDSAKKSLPVLERRIGEWCLRLGVELLIIDEVQRLDRGSDEDSAVTVRLQTFLDRGVVPLLLIGNGKSPAFFRRNQDFAARLGNPIELPRLICNKKEDADTRLFRKFCADFDDAMMACGAASVPAGLKRVAMLSKLHTVSQGHVGRVARLLQQAFELAAERDAATVEPYDLSRATRGYAMDNGWVDHDPFSKA